MKIWPVVGAVGIVGGAAVVIVLRRRAANASPSTALVTYPAGTAIPSYPATPSRTATTGTTATVTTLHTTPYRYTVRSGDTLSSIADRDRTTWQELADMNGIANPNQLTVGEQLYLPQPMPSAPGPSGSATASRSPDRVVSPTSGGIGSGYGGVGTASGGSGVDRLQRSGL